MEICAFWSIPAPIMLPTPPPIVQSMAPPEMHQSQVLLWGGSGHSPERAGRLRRPIADGQISRMDTRKVPFPVSGQERKLTFIDDPKNWKQSFRLL